MVRERVGAPQPGVGEHPLGAEAVGGLAHQQLTDEILSFAGYIRPLLLGEGVPALLDRIEEQLLTSAAVLAALPAAVGAAVGPERRVAA